MRSYRTLSPLPGRSHGGLLSVALSLGSPPPGVTRHRYSVEPGLSSRIVTDTGGRPTLWLRPYSSRSGGGPTQPLNFGAIALDIVYNNLYTIYDVLYINIDVMITSGQIRSARALLGIDQRTLAEKANLSLPTVQRMEASEGTVRGNIDSLTKLVEALEMAGIELIGEGAVSSGSGRGVRLREAVPQARPQQD